MNQNSQRILLKHSIDDVPIANALLLVVDLDLRDLTLAVLMEYEVPSACVFPCEGDRSWLRWGFIVSFGLREEITQFL